MDTQFGDTVVEAGTHVTVLWAAANLDPEKFTDPMTVNLTRRPNPHYSFASGFHRCLGVIWPEWNCDRPSTNSTNGYPNT
jgi:cytochrome P450